LNPQKDMSCPIDPENEKKKFYEFDIMTILIIVQINKESCK